MSAVTRWWWVRHAPVVGHDGRLYGQSDVPCDTSDAAAFRALAAALPKDAVWVTSALRRTHATARAIAAAGLEAPEPVVEVDFAEQHFGHWQGLSWSEMEARAPAAYAAFWKNGARNAPPGGESFAQLMARTAAVIERLTAEHAGRDIVAVGHAGSIRGALAVALDLAPERAIAVRIDTLSLTRLEHFANGIHGANPWPDSSARWRVVGVNVPPGRA